MSHFTVDSFAAHLTRTFGGHAAADTDGRGRPILEFHIPNPQDSRHSISLTASIFRGSVSLCSLWFGQAEATAVLKPEDAVPAIESILSGEIVAVVRYKDRDAYDDRRKASHGRATWLYQLPDDAEAYENMLKKLKISANAWEKLMGTATGVYEVYTWEDAALYER